MPLGPIVRRLFGPYERDIAGAYRRIFIDLDDFAGVMGSWIPQATNILEVGCGEGAMTERIVRTYPDANLLAIDITPNVGRLFRGNSSRVAFSQVPVEEVAQRRPGSYDLVVLSDVMHHVPGNLRYSLLGAIRQAMAPEGSLIFKDWIISATPIHWLCETSDRYLTGDDVSYFTPQGMDNLLAETFGREAIRRKGAVKPWNNNVALWVRR
jgi:2-polyprenyl-3-methyl-5-hydroxy-6-metoxy-1,4-benzoquinol methylase